MNRALHVGENLLSRGLLEGSYCNRCGAFETTEHLFLYCPFAKEDLPPSHGNGIRANLSLDSLEPLADKKPIGFRSQTFLGPGDSFQDPMRCARVATRSSAPGADQTKDESQPTPQPNLANPGLHRCSLASRLKNGGTRLGFQRSSEHMHISRSTDRAIGCYRLLLLSWLKPSSYSQLSKKPVKQITIGFFGKKIGKEWRKKV
ncbi:unnamed protein product [Thlaspi arvense]|uniref:Reverse transcriptase zinc-binding domain-containing protein n=1 Tax=Thlaspi arvense TaxID=13288 RepID=A0AAU9RTV0_THLAR|nr:unnamed protein product [Thlaspi arvense]